MIETVIVPLRHEVVQGDKMIEFIDIHSHILPGIDDGAENIEMSLNMLKIAAENGIGRIILTPHNKPGRHNAGREHIHMLTERLRQLCTEQEIKISLHYGNELYYRSELPEQIKEGKAMTLSDSSYVLVEFNPMDDYSYIRNGIYQLLSEGFKVILAHAERYNSLLGRFDRIEELSGMGCYIQMNAGSVMGDYGYTAKKFTRGLLKRELAHFIATDSHNDKKRGPFIKDCARYLERKYGEDYMVMLLHDNPQHVLADEFI